VRAESAGLRGQSAAPETLAEWETVRALIDRRVFSWTGLLAALEETLPPGVRLVSVQPREAGGGAELTITAQGRTNEDALALLQALQANGDFQAAFLNGWREGREGVDISCSVTYVPRKAGAR
jgi:Tfp pilus assembly protein PilN